MALITTAEAKTLIPTLNGTDDDAWIATLITAVGQAFGRWCGYPGNTPVMESTSYTRDYDGNGGRDLALDVWPVTAITSVYDDTTLDFTSSTYLLSASDYAIVNSRTLRLKSTATHSAWSEGTGNVRVAFTAGYSAIPDDVKRLAQMAVRHAYDLRQTQGKTSVSQGQGNTSFADPSWLPAEVKQGLAGYRLPRVFL